jgi:poly(hydroxyalkanoate) granule-associated protein
MNTTWKDRLNLVGEPLKKGGRTAWLVGLGATAIGLELGGRVLNTLVEKGRSFEEERKPKVQESFRTWREKGCTLRRNFNGRLHNAVERGLTRMGVPTREEIRNLSTQVEALSNRLKEQNS